MNHKRLLSVLFLALIIVTTSNCSTKSEEQSSLTPPDEQDDLAKRNLERAMGIADTATLNYFVGDEMAMGRYYNPFTKTLSQERGSVWMYSSAIEAVNAILHSLQVAKDSGHPELYDSNFNRYTELLSSLYDNADYYLGSFELTSFTQTKAWSVYAVDRVGEKGKANVEGVLNVYDDQMWLIRELLESYRLTGNTGYLEKAEYLTAYVLDGWDTTLDQQGKEYGGIPWGPGYVTKHACSNGPLISSLVWLHEIYAANPQQIEYRFIDPEDRTTRSSIQRSKSDYYLEYAKKVYDWQRTNLLNQEGVYKDMMGGCGTCQIAYETVAGVRYRANTPLTDPVGEPYTYNSGTMLSGAADLYRVTKNAEYLNHGKDLSDNSFRAFAFLDKDLPGYYSYNIEGFRNWFNGVLLRGYLDIYTDHSAAVTAITSFQKNLDYGYSQYKQEGLLPTDLLKGWGDSKNGNGVEGMFQFTFAAEYALLARFEYQKNTNQK